jgi:hypothetical protein
VWAGRCIGVPEPLARYVVHDRRDRARPAASLWKLEASRDAVISRAEAMVAHPLRRPKAVMRARTARYWLRAGQRREALRVVSRSLRDRPTLEGLATLATVVMPPSLRATLIAARRRRSSQS